MKYTMILGFLIAILPVFVIAEGDSEVRACVPAPERQVRAVRECMFPDVPDKEGVQSYMKDDRLMSDKAKNIALCLAIEMGHFKNGHFDVEFIKEHLKEEIGSHPQLDAFIKQAVTAAQIANAVEGSDSEKAFTFAILQHAEDNMNLVRKIYCASRVSRQQ